MSVLLQCDAPDCGKSTPGVASLGSISCPAGWWMQVVGPRIVVACCGDHLSLAAGVGRGKATVSGAA